MKNLICLFVILIFSGISTNARACSLQDSSIVYFKLFSTQTYLPMSKKDFKGNQAGIKLVIENVLFRNLLSKYKIAEPKKFIENIRMKIFFEKNIYYISQQGEIELNHKLVGILDKMTRNSLDAGMGLYEWGSCRPFSDVLREEIEKNREPRKGVRF